mmetsp:Transcript_5451/g.17170  ORF Transcript_5451/g.17170 Transcript_5451/m.17170 type:complete len:238 (+) Transcript_5451:1815-2528(+)
MLSSELATHRPRRHQVRRVRHAHGEGRRSKGGAVHVPTPFGHQQAHDARVDAAAQKEAEVHVGHHPFLDSIVQRRKNTRAGPFFVVLLLRTKVVSLLPLGLVVADEVAVVEEVAVGEFANVAQPLHFHDGFQLGRERDDATPRVGSVVQRLDARGISRREDLAVFVGVVDEHEREHARILEPPHRLPRSQFRVEVRDDLAVRMRRATTLQVRVQLLVRVDLAVRGQSDRTGLFVRAP